MSKASLHNCGSCDHSSVNDGGDCASCKLAGLVKASKELKERQALREQKEKQLRQGVVESEEERFRIDDDDELSISERLTENGNDHTILYMVVMAAVLFVLVVLFSKMFA